MRARIATVLAIAGAVLVACQSTASESPSASASAAPSSSPSSAAPSPSATPIGSVVTTFGTGPGSAIARDVAAFDEGFVAVGVQLSAAIPNFGFVPPHEGRIWLSADGLAWQDVTPSNSLTNVDLTEVFVRTDGDLVVLGRVSQVVPGGTEVASLGAWESADGGTWQSIPSPIPGLLVNVETGEVGYIAVAYADAQQNAPVVRYSSDGASWSQVFQLPDGAFDVDAGDEGFVVIGLTPSGAYIAASGDGQGWVVSASPPAGDGPSQPAALEGDWVTATWDLGQPATAWSSANGLDWGQSGTIPMAQVTPDPQFTCHEYPTELVSTASAVVLSTSLSYPCSEGGFVVYGSTHVSSDGATWNALPFPSGVVGNTHSGSQVNGAAEVNDVLVFVGELNGQAAFWTNPLD
jgi:hypothetical protein